ncbi:MAG: shikimate dehydrogenase [Planctomycetota bacterium]
MICVSIGRGRHQHMIAEQERLVQDGISLVEFRLDYIRRDVNVQRLLAKHPCPVVITCRRSQDGGQWKQPEEDRITLLRTAIAEGVAYIDLEADIAKQVPRFGDTKRIISHHDFAATPEDLNELHARLCELDPDIVKIATKANNPHDNFRMLELVQNSQVPTIGFCMGDMGVPSRILCGKYGAPFSYATFSRDRSLAPGQLSYRQMRDEYQYDQIDKQTEIYGVIGDPIAQSLSPIIHNAAFRAEGMNKAYLPFRVPAEHLGQFLEDCEAFGFRGLSVTIPHKEAVLDFCQKVDGAARGIGAVNTLVFDGEKKHGFNTDYRGAMAPIDALLGTATRKTPLAGHTALVLGAGGAARAIVFGLIRRGADVAIASRTKGRAEALAKEFHCRAIDWEHRHNVKADVIVNATPVGMHPNVDETPFDPHYLRPNAIVFDTVYNPEQTLLYKEARQRRCQLVSGVDMFVGQAAVQFHHFTGEDPPIELMREALKRSVGAAQY